MSVVLDHFDKNRVERRLVGSDTKLSKVTQGLEDKFAAEYWEQVRLDKEREDEEVARQLQRKYNAERQEAEKRRKQFEIKDKEYALKLEFQDRKAKQQAAAAAATAIGPNSDAMASYAAINKAGKVGHPNNTQAAQPNNNISSSPGHNSHTLIDLNANDPRPDARLPNMGAEARMTPGSSRKHLLSTELKGDKPRELPTYGPYDPPWDGAGEPVVGMAARSRTPSSVGSGSNRSDSMSETSNGSRPPQNFFNQPDLVMSHQPPLQPRQAAPGRSEGHASATAKRGDLMAAVANMDLNSRGNGPGNDQIPQDPRHPRAPDAAAQPNMAVRPANGTQLALGPREVPPGIQQTIPNRPQGDPGQQNVIRLPSGHTPETIEAIQAAIGADGHRNGPFAGYNPFVAPAGSSPASNGSNPSPSAAMNRLQQQAPHRGPAPVTRAPIPGAMGSSQQPGMAHPKTARTRAAPSHVTQLPPGMTPEQHAALSKAISAEDARLAMEQQDFELAKMLQRREKRHAEAVQVVAPVLKIKGGGHDSEVASNEVSLVRFDDRSEKAPATLPCRPPLPPKEVPLPNMELVTSLLAAPIPATPAASLNNPGNATNPFYHHSTSTTGSTSTTSNTSSSLATTNMPMLSMTSSYNPPTTSSYVHDPLTSPSNAEAHGGQVNAPGPHHHDPADANLNTHARRRRDIIARGGVQVLPDALLPK